MMLDYRSRLLIRWRAVKKCQRMNFASGFGVLLYSAAVWKLGEVVVVQLADMLREGRGVQFWASNVMSRARQAEETILCRGGFVGKWSVAIQVVLG